MRAELVKIAPIDVMSSLDTSDTDEAWALREQLFGAHPDVVVGTLLSIPSARAWQMREAWLTTPAYAAHPPYDQARIISKSVTGLDDERSWELRKEAREHAPISAIASLKGVTSDKSWKWREKYIVAAPKAVLDTVSESDDARAWEMRERAVAHCKEAIDSIKGMDGGRAWHLREHYADLWPSTVVKSLAGLAGTPQGRRLVERQLRRYPENISLLKHASAIAVSADLDPEIGVD
jgi:dTMP kinase